MSSVSNLIALTVLIFGAVDVSQASHSLGPSPPPTTITPKTVNNTLSTSPAFVGKADIRGGELLKTQSIIKNRKAKVQTTVSKSAEIKELVSPDPLVDAEYIADTKLPTDKGNFRMRAYRVKDETFDPLSRYSNINSMEPIVIYAADKPPFGRDGKLLEHVPVRIHDQCLTSEVFRSRRCDCKEQLKLSMDYIQQHGGAVIYLQQEGRGIGLANKVAAYELQDQGFDTVDANLHLGFPDDARQYGVLPGILKDMGIQSIQLMTNNPRKINRLTALGIVITETIPILAHTNDHNRKYLETKADRMSHTNFGHILSNDELPAHGISNQRNREMVSQRQASSSPAATNGKLFQGEHQ